MGTGETRICTPESIYLALPIGFAEPQNVRRMSRFSEFVCETVCDDRHGKQPVEQGTEVRCAIILISPLYEYGIFASSSTTRHRPISSCMLAGSFSGRVFLQCFRSVLLSAQNTRSRERVPSSPLSRLRKVWTDPPTTIEAVTPSNSSRVVASAGKASWTHSAAFTNHVY